LLDKVPEGRAGTRTIGSVLALALGVAAPAAAEEIGSPANLGAAAAPEIRPRGFAFPIVQESAPTGETRQRRGILVSKQVGPGALLGFGFYESMPKLRTYLPEPGSDRSAKRKRRAAVGLTIGF
jgi:hypothetical protein